MSTIEGASSQEETTIKYMCGVDIRNRSCSGCVTLPDKSIVVKPITFANSRRGWKLWKEKLSQLGVPPSQILIGMEVTSRYGENLYRELEQSGYVLRLLRPRLAYQFHEHQGLHTKTDRLDAMTIVEVLLSGKAQIDSVRSEEVTTYWQLASLHTQLCDEAVVYQNEIHALVGIVFPEFTQIFINPCLPSALQVLQAYPSASEIVAAGTEAVAQVLEISIQPSTHYDRLNAQKLVELARRSTNKKGVIVGQSVSLRILCDQLEHIQANITRLQAEIEGLFTSNPQIRSLKQFPEPSPKPSITVDLECADLFGTTRLEYKLWIDYIFDWFGATLERRFRRYLVAIGLATIVWGLGLIISLMIGFAKDYLNTPAIYYFWVGIAWCSNALRWLSQVYHIRTNEVRSCFLVDDATYKSIVSPFARNAVRNKRIFYRGTLLVVPVLVYFGIIMLRFIEPLSFLAIGFPPSFPMYWLTGNFLLIKWIIITLFMWVAYIEAYTGVQLTLSTAPLYAKLATLPILPLPSLVSELFQGVLSLYVTGAAMWSFGIVLVELLYNARVDALGIGFLAIVIGLGIFAYLIPLAAVRKIWRKAKRRAISDAISVDFYVSNPPHDSDKLKVINEYIQTLNTSEPGKFNVLQLISFVTVQLLPVLPIIANTFLSGFSLVERISGK